MAQTNADFSVKFFSNPSISFATQHDLKLLFDTLANREERFTIFVGAGVSLDAGLPLWPRLIDNIIAQIPDKDWQREARLDHNDLMRKAEYVIRLTESLTVLPVESVILKALYLKSSGDTQFIRDPQPGRLADAIARLCISLGDRVDIITTNFDILLEKKVEEYGQNVDSAHFRSGIDDAAWAKGKGVLHLHGILVPGERAKGNIVLTENDFLEHGPQIKSFMLNRLKQTNVLFIGVSMTDPNLVGPLWDIFNSNKKHAGVDRKRCFMLSVAAPSVESSADAATVDEARDRAMASKKFAVLRTSYLRDTLDVNTIFFKSYGEQIQAIYEMSLALSDYAAYQSDDEATSSRYGFRLIRALRDSYRNIGCADNSEMPVGEHAEALSDLLHEHLTVRGGALRTVIDDARKDAAQAALQGELGKYQSDFDSEQFGLFLWLRLRASRGNDSYELRLVGSSVYRYRDAWSVERTADISPLSRFPAGRAAFRGQFVVEDFPVEPAWQLWGSAWAVPFSFFYPGADPRESVEVGVISLQSTRFWSEPWSSIRKRSVLSTLSEGQAGKLADELAGVGRQIVTTALPTVLSGGSP
ncbi:SIR2 family protein [Mycobacterium sp. 050134]|uniref:SIR2 family protein n=1 Tax=Mycobacterium sp. 050134 TaxID=3096111 RepID=UPI002EDBA1CF